MSDSSAVDPRNPPPPAPAAVAGMWYWLGPVAVIVLVAILAMFFWRGESRRDQRVAPTTGVEESQQEDTTDGHNPGPHPRTPEQERKYRGGN